MNGGDFEAKCELIDRLGAKALGYGVSSFRLETCLTRLARNFGLQSEFTITPERLVSVLWREGEEGQRIHVSRARDLGISMSGVAELEDLVRQFESERLPAEECIRKLTEIKKQAKPFGPALLAVAFGLIGASFAVLMALSWRDVLIGGGLGVVTFGVVLLLGRSSRAARLINPLAAMVASSLACTIAATVAPGSRTALVTLCALICLIPNPGLVLGIGELSAGHFISGAIRLISAAVTMVELAFGAFLGTALASAIWLMPPSSKSTGVGSEWVWPAVAVLGTGLAMLFQVRLKEIAWVVAACLLAWAGIVVGGKLMGSGPGDLMGAMILGLFANTYALRGRGAASVILLPGLMVLAPGYASYLGLNTLQTSGVDAGFVAEFKVFVTVAWIIGGLFIANTVIPPTSAVSRDET